MRLLLCVLLLSSCRASIEEFYEQLDTWFAPYLNDTFAVVEFSQRERAAQDTFQLELQSSDEGGNEETESEGSDDRAEEISVRRAWNFFFRECNLPRNILKAALLELERSRFLAAVDESFLRRSVGCPLFTAMDQTRLRAVATSQRKDDGTLIRDAKLIGQFYQWEQFVNILVTFARSESEKLTLRRLGRALTSNMKKAVCWEHCRDCYPCWHDLASMINSVTKVVVYVTPKPGNGTTSTDAAELALLSSNFEDWVDLVFQTDPNDDWPFEETPGSTKKRLPNPRSDFEPQNSSKSRKLQERLMQRQVKLGR